MFSQSEYEPEAFIKELEALADYLENGSFEEPLRECYPIVQADIQDHFDAREGPDSIWPPHAESTIRRYGVHPLLILSGQLVAAAIGEGTGHFVEYSEREMRYGVSKEIIVYAGHDHGFPDRNIPQREYMWISDTAREQCYGIINQWIADKLIGT